MGYCNVVQTEGLDKRAATAKQVVGMADHDRIRPSPGPNIGQGGKNIGLAAGIALAHQRHGRRCRPRDTGIAMDQQVMDVTGRQSRADVQNTGNIGFARQGPPRLGGDDIVEAEFFPPCRRVMGIAVWRRGTGIENAKDMADIAGQLMQFGNTADTEAEWQQAAFDDAHSTVTDLARLRG